MDDPERPQPPSRRRRRRWPAGLVLAVVVVAAVGISMLGGYSGERSPGPGAASDAGWINPAMQLEPELPAEAASRFLVRTRPVLGRSQQQALQEASEDLGVRSRGRSTRASDGSQWFALELAEPRRVDEVRLGLEDSGALEVIVDPPRWMHDTRAPRFAEQWALAGQGVVGVDAPRAWEQVPSAGSRVVAVVDSGVDASHPDLANRVLAGRNVTTSGSEDDVSDPIGHGTAVASVVAAAGTGIDGIAPDVRILPVKVFASGYQTTSADIAEAVDWAVARGADVINLSLGCTIRGSDPSSTCRSEVELSALQRARDAGVLVVTAAGNTGTNIDATLSYPQRYGLDNIVNVAASTPSGSLAAWSNRGAGSVHLAAPGEGILVAIPGGGYVTADGTSFSAPLVAGTAAMLLADAPGTSPRDLIEQLQRSSTPVDALRAQLLVGGVLDAGAAVHGEGRHPGQLPAVLDDPWETRELREVATAAARPPQLLAPGSGRTAAGAGGVALRWSIQPRVDVWEVSLARSARTITTTAGPWLEQNTHGTTWASARRVEQLRTRPLPAGTWHWQVAGWDADASQAVLSPIRSFRVSPAVGVRRVVPTPRAGARRLPVRFQTRSNTPRLATRVDVAVGGRRVARRSASWNVPAGATGAWRQRSLDVPLRQRLVRGQVVTVRVEVGAGPARRVATRRMRVG